MDINTIKKEINSFWDSQIVPTLIEYIKIPNKSTFPLIQNGKKGATWIRFWVWQRHGQKRTFRWEQS